MGLSAFGCRRLQFQRDSAGPAARTDGSQPEMAIMREKLHAYLEIDAYLTDQGVDLA